VRGAPRRPLNDISDGLLSGHDLAQIWCEPQAGKRPPTVNADNDIAEFLTSRRANVTPERAGLPSYGKRRVAGLRREEVAFLAGVSADYYRRLDSTPPTPATAIRSSSRPRGGADPCNEPASAAKSRLTFHCGTSAASGGASEPIRNPRCRDLAWTVMEPRGLEPLTFWLQTRCSPS
jgi:hypothetical protein